MVDGIGLTENFYKELISAWILVPMIWFYMKWQRQDQEDRYKQLISINEQQQEIQKERDKEIVKTFDRWFKGIQMAIWRVVIESVDVAMEQAVTHFQLSAIEKLDFIENRLNKNNTKERINEVIKSIEIECRRIDNESVYRPLSNFNTKAGNLGYILKENYDYENFMLEVKDVILNNSEIKIKMTDMKTLMKSYQSKVVDDVSLQFNIQ